MSHADVGATNIIEQYYEELNFLSDLFSIENDNAIYYVKNESNYTDLENVSVVIDFIKPIIRCHGRASSGFANINKIKR